MFMKLGIGLDLKDFHKPSDDPRVFFFSSVVRTDFLADIAPENPPLHFSS